MLVKKSNLAVKLAAVAVACTTMAAANAAMNCAPIIGDSGDLIRIAVASNYYEPAKLLATRYVVGAPAENAVPATPAHPVRIEVCGDSTGNWNKLFRANGNPTTAGFHAFFAANTKTIDQLIENVTSLFDNSSNPFEYAYGVLAAKSSGADIADLTLEQIVKLAEPDFKIAWSVPTLAPYGQLTEQLLAMPVADDVAKVTRKNTENAVFTSVAELKAQSNCTTANGNAACTDYLVDANSNPMQVSKFNLYENIAGPKIAVNTGVVQVGFLAHSDACKKSDSSIDENKVRVFDGFTTKQNAVKFKNTGTALDTVVADFVGNFAQPTTVEGGAYVIDKFCYTAPN